MEYKRKVVTQQEGVDGYDEQFGKLKMLARSKRMMPVIFAVVMFIFITAIFTIEDFRMQDHIVLSLLAIVLFLIGLMQLCTMWDQVAFYEFGLVDHTLLNLRKKRLAYDDIDAIVEVKHVRFGKNNDNRRVSMWKIYPKSGKKAIVIDATAYIGISNIIVSVRHDTKIKNISD